MIVSQAHTIGVKEFLGTDEEGQVVRLAVQDCGHLVRASGPLLQFKRVSLEQYSDMIESNYDIRQARTGETVKVLRQVHQRNQVQHEAMTQRLQDCHTRPGTL